MKNLPEVLFQDLGLMDYQVCWDLQEKYFAETLAIKTGNRNLPENEQKTTENHLFFVEHPHVYTLGKSGKPEHLLLNEQGLAEHDATYYRINRGGDITYHGPGQLVAYPIFDLDHFFSDIHRYLRYLEEAVIRCLADFGIHAGRYEGYTGVWLDADSPEKARKICAMGVKCSRWVTMHGLALNVNTDLEYFKHIIPCGIDDKAVTSMQAELGAQCDMEKVKARLLSHLASVFQFKDIKS